MAQVYLPPLMPRLHVILGADSRAKYFRGKGNPNYSSYKLVYVTQCGGKVQDISPLVADRLKVIPHSELVFIQLACGINNLTKKFRHPGGVELIPNENPDAVHELRAAKQLFRTIHPNVVVSLATIPCVDFVKANKCYKAQDPIYSVDQLQRFQSEFSDQLAVINHEICVENQIVQSTVRYGNIKALNLYWHQCVEKVSFKGKSSEAKIKKKRIPDSALTDGIHASLEIQTTWFNHFHANMMSLKKYVGI